MSQKSHRIHLLVVEDDRGRREFVLDGSVYAVGRDPKCDIRLISQFVSRHHATLVQLLNGNDIDSYRIVDGNLKGKLSVNGLLINGHKLLAHDLQHEDEIVFGPQVRGIYYLLERSNLLRSSQKPVPLDLPPNSYTDGGFSPTFIGSAEASEE